MKTMIRGASYFSVLAFGLGVGYYAGFHHNQAANEAFDMAETAYYSAYIDSQMTAGTDESREEAILSFLALIEKRRLHSPTLIHTEKTLATDSAFAYAKLSVLAQKRGANGEAQEYLKRAASYCPQMQWSECSAEKITAVMEDLDRKNIFEVGLSK